MTRLLLPCGAWALQTGSCASRLLIWPRHVWIKTQLMRLQHSMSLDVFFLLLNRRDKEHGDPADPGDHDGDADQCTMLCVLLHHRIASSRSGFTLGKMSCSSSNYKYFCNENLTCWVFMFPLWWGRNQTPLLVTNQRESTSLLPGYQTDFLSFPSGWHFSLRVWVMLMCTSCKNRRTLLQQILKSKYLKFNGSGRIFVVAVFILQLM